MEIIKKFIHYLYITAMTLVAVAVVVCWILVQ
jgi:hypothetical protein